MPVALGLRGLVFGRMPAGQRRLVGGEFDHDVPGSRLAFDGLERAAAHEKARPELREGGTVGPDVVLVGVGVGHVDAADPVSLGHHSAPSTRTNSATQAPSRLALAAWYSGER